MLKKVLVASSVVLVCDVSSHAFNLPQASTLSSSDAFARGGRRGGGGGRRSRSYSSYRSFHSSSSYAAPVSTASSQIETLQTSLSERGLYAGAIDGKMGAQTKDAIRQFQAQNGLRQDGIAGTQTLAKLGIL